MSVLDGRVTTTVSMLPHALRTNRPTKMEAAVAADVIEQLLGLLRSADHSQGSDPAVVSPADLTALNEVVAQLQEEGNDAAADTVERMVGVLTRVSLGRSASHWMASYERAVERLVLMRQLVPAAALERFDAEQRARRAA